MKIQLFFLVIISLLFNACQDNFSSLDDLNAIKTDFINSILEENFDESPFHINYSFRTVFFSKDLISLFGEIHVYNHLPHGWSLYESKTFCKVNGKFKEITLENLFPTPQQKEFLRSYCEASLKKDPCTYFSGNDVLYTTLDQTQLHTFVLDDQFLIIIFQPYSVGGCGDGPFHVKIPYQDLKDKWNSDNFLIPVLNRVLLSKDFTSSWDAENFYNNL